MIRGFLKGELVVAEGGDSFDALGEAVPGKGSRLVEALGKEIEEPVGFYAAPDSDKGKGLVGAVFGVEGEEQIVVWWFTGELGGEAVREDNVAAGAAPGDAVRKGGQKGLEEGIVGVGALLCWPCKPEELLETLGGRGVGWSVEQSEQIAGLQAGRGAEKGDGPAAGLSYTPVEAGEEDTGEAWGERVAGKADCSLPDGSKAVEQDFGLGEGGGWR